eukprot:scaffold117907_cov63-Phaeocystis_antarctica.AAC.2
MPSRSREAATRDRGVVSCHSTAIIERKRHATPRASKWRSTCHGRADLVLGALDIEVHLEPVRGARDATNQPRQVNRRHAPPE